MLREQYDESVLFDAIAEAGKSPDTDNESDRILEEHKASRKDKSKKMVQDIEKIRNECGQLMAAETKVLIDLKKSLTTAKSEAYISITGYLSLIKVSKNKKSSTIEITQMTEPNKGIARSIKLLNQLVIDCEVAIKLSNRIHTSILLITEDRLKTLN